MSFNHTIVSGSFLGNTLLDFTLDRYMLVPGSEIYFLYLNWYNGNVDAQVNSVDEKQVNNHIYYTQTIKQKRTFSVTENTVVDIHKCAHRFTTKCFELFY